MTRDEYYANLSKTENTIKHWKYIDKIKTAAGKWRYIYNQSELVDKVNDVYNKVSDTYTNMFKNNIYDTDKYSYKDKISKIENTKEWQDIVKSDNPEYTKVDENGNKTHDIDSYLLKKKHPGLDALDDAINGRDITINKITKESATAGLNDYARTGMEYVALMGTLFGMKIKNSQGSYEDEKSEIKERAKNVYDAADSTAVKTVSDINRAKESKSDYQNVLNNAIVTGQVYADDYLGINDATKKKRK